jgi:hypothetical protein
MATQQTEKKKGFWARLIEKLDKSMEDKAKKAPCCSGSKKGSSCC